MTSLGNKEIMAENLSYYIERSGRTQKEISEVLDVATSTLNNWVTAKKYPRIDKIEMLANYFGIQKSDLIERKVSDKDKKNNDILSDIIIKMQSDDNFFTLVKSMYSNVNFYKFVESAHELDSEQISSLQLLLGTFKK